MGLTIEMNPAPSLPNPIRTPEDLARLPESVNVNEKLGYVFEAVNLTRHKLNGEVPLIGFCGAPWTLMAYMVEGGGSKTYQKAKEWLYRWPEASRTLLAKVADVCVDLLVGQVLAGAQVSSFSRTNSCLTVNGDLPVATSIRLLGKRTASCALPGDGSSPLSIHRQTGPSQA